MAENEQNDIFQVGIYLPKINNKNTRTRCEICSKLTIKILERHQWRRKNTVPENLKGLTLYLLFKVFKGCLPQILLGPLLNILSQYETGG